MRIALLIMTEPAGPPGSPPRAQLRLGWMTLGRHQLALALALGCERVICLAPLFDDHLLGLQHVAEAAQVGFHVVSGPRALAQLVGADDELIVLGDGLFAAPDLALALLEGGSDAGNRGGVVVVQPVEAGLAAGFERIDINRADAAALRMPGALLGRLSDLAGDVDVSSALLRIALQAGLRMEPLPAGAVGSGRWALVRFESEAQSAEALWIRQQVASGGAGVSDAIAARLVRLAGPALLHAGRAGPVVGAAGVFLGVLGLLGGWLGMAVAGFLACAAAWVVLLAAALLMRIERGGAMDGAGAGRWHGGMAGWAMDAVLAVLIARDAPLSPAPGWLAPGFAAVMLLGLARLVARMAPARPERRHGIWLSDRAVIALVLALASLFEGAGAAVAALSVGLLALAVVASGRPVPPRDG